MKELFLGIQNKNLIRYDERYVFFFTEEKIDVKSPVSSYYLKLSDLSVNVRVSLKWSLWGYFFMANLSETLISLRSESGAKDIITGSIHNKIFFEFKPHILYIDNEEIPCDSDFKKAMESTYTEKLFSANSSLHFKLKINLGEYILINDSLFPYLIKTEDTLINGN